VEHGDDAIDEGELMETSERYFEEDQEDQDPELEDDEEEENEQEDNLDIPFSAFTFKGNKTLHFISTAHDPLECLPHKETRQTKRGERNVRINAPSSRVEYSKCMGSVDGVNCEIMRNYFPHKILRWKIALLIWLIRALVQNSRVVYNFSHDPLSTVDFLRELMVCLGPNIPGQLHELIPARGQKCFLCRKEKKNSSCEYRCKQCNRGIHESCFYSEKHQNLFQSN